MRQVTEALFPVALILIGAVPGYALGEIIYRLVNVFMSRQKTLARLWKRLHGPGVLASALWWGLLLVQAAGLNDGEAATTFSLMVVYWLAVCGIWAGVVLLLTFVEWLYYRRGMRLADFNHARSSRGQIAAIINFLPILSGFALLALGLTTYNAWHQFSDTAIAIGASGAVFAGIVGIGVMGNVAAGVIASASGVVAEGDVVELVPGEAGRVREITLTHAKIAISDEKEISIPLSRFATGQFDILKRTQPSMDGLGRNPFRRWNQARKRSSAHVSKTWVSWEMDIESVPYNELRDEIVYWFSAVPQGQQAPQAPPRPRAMARQREEAAAQAAVASAGGQNNAPQPLLQKLVAAQQAAAQAVTNQSAAQQGLHPKDYAVRMATVGRTDSSTRIRISIEVQPGDLGARQDEVREWIAEWLREHAEVSAASAADQQKVLDDARAAALNAKAATQAALQTAVQNVPAQAVTQAVQNASQQAVQAAVQQANVQAVVTQAVQTAVQQANVQAVVTQAVRTEVQQANVQTVVTQAVRTEVQQANVQTLVTQAVQTAVQQANVQTVVAQTVQMAVQNLDIVTLIENAISQHMPKKGGSD